MVAEENMQKNQHLDIGHEGLKWRALGKVLEEVSLVICIHIVPWPSLVPHHVQINLLQEYALANPLAFKKSLGSTVRKAILG